MHPFYDQQTIKVIQKEKDRHYKQLAYNAQGGLSTIFKGLASLKLQLKVNPAGTQS